MGNGIKAVLVITALLWIFLPKMLVVAMPESKPAASQVSVSHFQTNVSPDETLEYDELFRNIEDHIDKVYYFAGDISHVEFMPDGYADSLVVEIGGDISNPSQYLYVYIEDTLNERVLVGDIVQFRGQVVGFEVYESRPVPAVLMIEYMGRLVCEGEPPTCSVITPAPAVTFTLKYAAPVRSGPGYEYDIVGRMKKGDTVEISGRSDNGQWLKLGDSQWILALLAVGSVESLPIAAGPPAPAPGTKVVLTPTPTPGTGASVAPTPTSMPPTPTSTPTPTPGAVAAVAPTPTPTPQTGSGAEVDDADAKSVSTYIEQGVAKAALGQYQEAITEFDAALRLDPNSVVALANRSLVLIRLGRYEEAIADYDTALHLAPEEVVFWANRGAAKAALGRYEEAIADYDTALQIDPDRAVIRANRGLAKAELGRYEEAIVDYDAALRLDPDNARALSYRGMARFQLGRYEEAIADYDAALRIDPGNSVLIDHREQARIQMAQVSGATVNTNANLRAGPGTNYPVVGGAKQGDQVNPVAQISSGQWLQLDSGYWIYAPLVDNVPSGLPVTRTVPPPPSTPTPQPQLVPTPTAVPTATAAPTSTPSPSSGQCSDVGKLLADYQDNPREFSRNWHDTDVCAIGLSWDVTDWITGKFYIDLLPSRILGENPWRWWPQARLQGLRYEQGVVTCEIDEDDMEANTARILGEINIDHEARGTATGDLRRVDVLLVTGRLEVDLLSSYILNLKNCQVHEMLLEVPSD